MPDSNRKSSQFFILFFTLCADKTSETRAELEKHTIKEQNTENYINLHHFQVEALKTDTTRNSGAAT